MFPMKSLYISCVHSSHSEALHLCSTPTRETMACQVPEDHQGHQEKLGEM